MILKVSIQTEVQEGGLTIDLSYSVANPVFLHVTKVCIFPLWMAFDGLSNSFWM